KTVTGADCSPKDTLAPVARGPGGPRAGTRVGDCQCGTIERTEPVRPALGARCVGARTPRASRSRVSRSDALQRPTKAAVAPDPSSRYCELTHCAPRNATYAGTARFPRLRAPRCRGRLAPWKGSHESVGRLCLETRHVASAVILVFAEAAAEKQLAAALKGTSVFAVLPAEIEARKTQAVLEAAMAQAAQGKAGAALRAGAADVPLTIGAFRPRGAASTD